LKLPVYLQEKRNAKLWRELIGQQGRELLDAVCDPAAPQGLCQVPAIESLRHVGLQNSRRVDDVVRWRSSEDLPPASRYIGSPSDEEAHCSKKRRTQWVGEKVHRTETGETELPLLIPHGETTSAPIPDDAMLPTMHAELDRQALFPPEHLVDTGDVDAQLLVESQQAYQVDLVGPTRNEYRWPANQQKGFDASHFLIDWDQHQAICPEGQTSVRWSPTKDKWQNQVIRMKFSLTECQKCPSRSLWTQSASSSRRSLTIRPQAQYQAFMQRRNQETSKEFIQGYAKRAGIEGTISQGIRTMGLRRSRSLGQEKTHRQHLATAAALHLVRGIAWVEGIPRAQTRRSSFARLSDGA